MAHGSQNIIIHFAFLPGAQSPFGFVFQYNFFSFFNTLVSFWKVVCRVPVSGASQQGLFCWRPFYAENCVVHSASYFLFPFHSLSGFLLHARHAKALSCGSCPYPWQLTHGVHSGISRGLSFFPSPFGQQQLRNRSERQDRVQTQTHEKEHMECNKLNATQQGKEAGRGEG